MALKPYTMSFKEKNEEEVLLYKILSKKTSPMAYAKDVLIDVLVRGKSYKMDENIIDNKAFNCDKDNVSELFGLD